MSASKHDHEFWNRCAAQREGDEIRFQIVNDKAEPIAELEVDGIITGQVDEAGTLRTVVNLRVRE